MTAPPPKNDFAKYVPLLLMLLALALRLYGITWALPDKTRFYSYHVDETMVVAHALDLDPVRGRVDPNFYNYGSLALLVNGAVIHAGRAAGLVDFNPVTVRPGGLALPSATELLVARLVTALFGAGTVGFLYGTGRLLYNWNAGIVAAGLYAVAPLAVQHAHFATVDIAAVFFVAGSLFFAARFVSGEGKGIAALLWCGLFAGFAAATKYNAGLVALSGVAAWALIAPRKPLFLAGLCGATALGLLLGCPGIVLNPAAVVRDVSYEARHVATGHGEVFVDTLPAFVFHIVSSLRWGLTLPLLLLCVAAIGVALTRRRRGDLLLAAFAVPYYLLIGFAAVKFARYTLPLFPPLFLLAGAVWDGWRNVRVQTAFRTFAAFAAVSALGFAVALDQTMTRTDPRDAAAAYIWSLPGVRSVGFAAGPWFYSPPLDPYLAHPSPQVAQEVALQNVERTLIPAVRFGADNTPARTPEGALAPMEWTFDSNAPVPDAVTFGEIHYVDWLRTRNTTARAYLIVVEPHYRVRKNFTNPVTLFGLPVVRVFAEPGEPWHGLPIQALPHDMLYTNPSVSVWSRAAPTPRSE